MDAVHDGKSFSNSATPTTAVAINAIGRRQQLAPIIAATRPVAAGSRSADLESEPEQELTAPTGRDA